MTTLSLKMTFSSLKMTFSSFKLTFLSFNKTMKICYFYDVLSVWTFLGALVAPGGLWGSPDRSQ